MSAESIELDPNKQIPHKKSNTLSQNHSNNHKLSSHSSEKSLYKQLFNIPCYYHPGRTITNFCTDPKCLMPLCPLCIDIHQQEQQGRLHLANYEPLEIVYSQGKKLNKQLRKEQKNCEKQIQKIDKTFKKTEDEIMKLLEQKEKQLVDMIQDSFHEIKAQVKQQFSNFSNGDVEKEIKHAEDEIENIKKRLTKSKKQLQEQNKILPQIIKLYEPGYVSSIHSNIQSIQSRLQILSSRIPQVQINDMFLQNIQSNIFQLISFRNRTLGNSPPLFGKKSIIKQQQKSYARTQLPVAASIPVINFTPQNFYTSRQFQSSMIQNSRIPTMPTTTTIVPNINLMRNSLQFI